MIIKLLKSVYIGFKGGVSRVKYSLRSMQAARRGFT